MDHMKKVFEELGIESVLAIKKTQKSFFGSGNKARCSRIFSFGPM